tara:strand:- start:4804 stop:5856 length:1053 start_codon:yes stop_codon:yes gene_type:complete
MATNYSGKQWQAAIYRQDLGVIALGTSTTAASDVDGTNILLELDTVNPINYSGMIQQNSVVKSGRRALHAEDITQNYGFGECTWDFEYLVKHDASLQLLLSLVVGKGLSAASAMTINAAAIVGEDLSHGYAGADDGVACVLLLAPTAPNALIAHDHRMHSAVLQNLTLAMDMGTDYGRLRASGQFMSGYKPKVEDFGTSPDAGTGPAAAGASNFEHSLMDFTTISLGGHDVVCKAFTMTINNPATRVGMNTASTSGETDGYVRGGEFSIEGSMTVKLDASAMTYLSDWQAGTPAVISLTDASTFVISIPAATLMGWNNDMAEEGVFIEIPWKATLGVDGASNLAVLTMNN